MKPTARYFRWFLVASLSLSLIGGGFCSPKAMADCSAGQASSHVKKHCCCGVNCKCGASCCGNSTPEKSQQPTKTTERDLRDLVKTTAAVSCVVCEIPLGQDFSKPTSIFCGDSNAPQTLVTQHTCLQV